MNKSIQFLSCAIILLMALTVFPNAMLVSADTTDEFGDGSKSKTVTFTGEGSNKEVTIKLPAEADVLDAMVKLEGDENGGSYLYHPTLLIDDRNQNRGVIWNFNGSSTSSGYGSLGEQTVFQDNSSSASLSFVGEEEKTTRLKLPKNATVTSATVDISGRKNAGTMNPPEVVSEGTLVSSTNVGNPDVAVVDSNVYMVWEDDGDLNYAGKDRDIFFKKSPDNGQTWGKAMSLTDTTIYSYNPAIAVNGNEVYVAWVESSTIWFRMSEDSGDNWNEPVKVESGYTGPFEMVETGGHIYMAWEYNGAIQFATSEDGKDWKVQQISGGGSGGESNVYDPWLDARDNYVYVIWRELDSNTHKDKVAFKASDNNGARWPKSTTYILESNNTIYTPQVACDEGGHVYAFWREYVSGQYMVNYSYSSSNGDDNTWSPPKRIDDATSRIERFAVFSEKETGSTNVYLAWSESSPYQGDYEVNFKRSIDEKTWPDPSVLIGNGLEPVLYANGGGDIIAAYRFQNNSGFYHWDILLNHSSDRGTTWNDGVVVSTELFDGLSAVPAIAVVGDDVYIVWQEQGNKSGDENGVDADIFFRHYDGSAWSEITVLSDAVDDVLSTAPDIAVDGNTIYVVWEEWDQDNIDQTDYDIHFRYSSNGGSNWGAIGSLTESTDGTALNPHVGISGSSGFVVWEEYKPETRYSKIYFRKINAGTPAPVTIDLTEDSTDSAYQPAIAVDGSDVHVVWHDFSDQYGSDLYSDIVYRKSEDSGRTFGDVVVVSQTDTYSYTPVISVGSYIYVIWREGSPQFSRSDSGDDWSAQTRVTSDSTSIYSIASYEDSVFFCYEYYMLIPSSIKVTYSENAGDTWEDPIVVSDKNSSSPTSPDIDFDNDALHLCWHDAGNISGSGYDLDIIHRQSVDSYPSNVELDIGNDGDVDWQHSGELNDGNSPQTYSEPSFVKELNDALDAAKSQMDAYLNEMAVIEIRVTSDTAGLVVLDSLIIEYDYSVRTQDFSDTLNNYIENHQDDQDADGNIEIPLIITTDSAGELTLYDLFVRYDVHKSIFITSPEDDAIYTTSIDIEWEAKNFESDDDVRISYYDGNDWNVLDTVPANQERWDGWDSSGENGRLYKVKIEYVDDTHIKDETDYFMIDNYSPTTTHTFDYTDQYNDGETIWGREVDIQLKPNDKFDGGDDGSGVNHTHYRVDDGEWIEYSGIFTIDTHGDNGTHTFDYYSVDIMDNPEATNRHVVHIDAVQPEIDAWNIPEVRYDSDKTISVSVSVSDADTGIDEGATIHNKLQYALGKEGQPTLHQNWQNLDNRDLTDGVYSGDITEDWLNLTDDEKWGTFYLYVRCTIADNVANTNTSEFFEIIEKDIFPPGVLEVASEVDADTDNTYFIESQVKLYIVSDEEGVTGSVSITGGAPGSGLFEADLQADGMTYWAMWDTTGIIPNSYNDSYNVKFTLTDPVGNYVENSSLFITIQDILVPELSVPKIIIDQNGLQGNIANQIQTNINISVYNSGTLDVEGVELTVYQDDKLPGKKIALVLVDLGSGEAKLVTILWTPQITQDSQEIEIIAVIQELEGDDILENNEESQKVTVNKVPDFKVTSVTIQDEGGKTVTKAREGDKLKIIANVENIGDVDASMTVSAYYSGTTRIATDNSVTIPAGGSRTVTLDWPSATWGELTITVRADPGNDVLEKNEDNNEQSIQLTVEEKSTGGSTEGEEDMPIIFPILIAIVVIGGIGGAVYFMKMKGDEEDDWGGSDSSVDDMGWDDEPAAPASKPAPRPKPGPMQKEAPGPAGSEVKPKSETRGTTSAAVSSAAAGAVAAVKVKCPKCAAILSIKTAQRPVTVKCPKCETRLTVKK